MTRSLRLIVQSPSPTTTLFTITDAPLRSSRLSRAAHTVRLVLRALFAVAIFVVLLALVREAWNSKDRRFTELETGADVRARLEIGAANVGDVRIRRGGTWWDNLNIYLHNWTHAQTWPHGELNHFRVFAGSALCVILLYALSLRRDTEETLLILQFLGVQISSTSRSYLSTSTTRFIPTTAIQDVFIHEAFTGFEVRYYLGIVVEGEKEVMVVFGRLMPGLKVLEKVWRGVRRVLYLQDEGNGHRKRATAET